ncbi:MAG: class I SAM-dependent methyltransferase [Tepidiformaceae bacterium]
MSQLEMGRWLKDRGLRLSDAPSYASRPEMYTAIAKSLPPAASVLYLEFGVFQGASMRMWSDALQGHQAALHGFDSFEGLPEAWNEAPAGTYTAHGAVPSFSDPRIELHVGWFSETLPSFGLSPHDRLIVHLDADLYSSTKYVLDALAESIVPGSILIFDEFNDRNHEFRAFREFTESHRDFAFRLIGASWDGMLHLAIERTA